MPEIQLHKPSRQQPILQEVKLESLQSATLIEDLGTKGIAIDDHEGMVRSLDTLRGEFAIEDSVFDVPRNRLMLVAIADQLNTIEKSSDVSDNQKFAEKEYLADLVMDTVGPFTQFRDHFDGLVSQGEKVSDDTRKAAYNKYTQPELTADLTKLIKGPQFDELRKRLGITEETPYEIKVLSIDDENGYQSHGLDPGVDWDDPEEDYENIRRERDYRSQYKQGLIENGKELRKMLGKTNDFSPAWVSTFDDGTKYLCIMSSTAEKVLYKNEKRASYYKERDYEIDLSVIKHEYVHTQREIFQGTHIGTGIALEELRAEHFSGDNHGYIDIKRFFKGIEMLTGYSPKSSFELGGKGYDEAVFMEDIARNIGLKGYLDCMVAIPSVYAEDPDANPYVKAIVAHNGGGLSGLFARVVERIKAERGPEAVEESLSAWVDRVRESLKDAETVSVESWFAYGSPKSLEIMAIENFRQRYPDESDRYDYQLNKPMTD